ncbi:MAG: hypothetical protein K8S23_10940 [Candidatus Cloacimonetes bacterium]|nr:hypothetical protein [Candidatus Cloacimonadota bacterium]
MINSESAVEQSPLACLYMGLKKYNKAEKKIDVSIRVFQELKSKYQLCFIFNDKAELCFILKRFDEAKILCEESNKSAEEIGNQFVSFYNNLLLLKIEFYQSNDLLKKEKQINEMKKILSKAKGGYAISTLNYELYKMTNQLLMNNYNLAKNDKHKYFLQAKDYKDKALKLNKEAYKKTPDIEYKERIEEMEEEGTREKGKRKKKMKKKTLYPLPAP